MAKYLGVDYGLARVGLAVSDPEGRLAFPLCTLKLGDFPRRAALLDALAKLARLEKAAAIVIGLPLFPDGGENLMCRQVRNMAARLARRFTGPIHFVPETFSSEQALADLKECGMSKKKFRSVVDQQAACRILQSFLEQQEMSP